MAGVEVLGGDFPQGRAEYGFGLLVFPKKPKQGHPNDVTVNPKDELLSVQVIGQEEESRLGKAAGAGIAGGLLLGGVGLVLGGLLGAADRQKKEITFSAQLSGGRQLLARTDAKTFEKLQAFAFGNTSESE